MTSYAVKVLFTLLALPIVLLSRASSVMLRRLSTTFSRKKKDENRQINGSIPNSADENGQPKKSRTTAHGAKEEDSDHNADREQVSNVFKDFAQLLHASQRPLPTQTGDGSYVDQEVPSGMMADLKSLGFKDIKTLKEVMQTKASGALQDDKTYLMERVIQVR